MEAELKLPGGGSKLVVVAGQPLDINEDDCMLFTFTDLEPRRQAESALRESEERFAKAFRLSPVPTLLCTAHERRVLDVNEAFTRTTEYDAEALIGKTIDEIPFIDDPEANRRLFAALEKAATSKGWTSGCARKGASRSTAWPRRMPSASTMRPATCWCSWTLPNANARSWSWSAPSKK
ncbi:PAS domain-containing protein [Serratia ureilytica]